MSVAPLNLLIVVNPNASPAEFTLLPRGLTVVVPRELPEDHRGIAPKR